MTAPRFELRDLSVSFDGLTVLDHLSLTLERGELRFIIGPNGAGKTTLLDVITGRTRPASGSIDFEGHKLIGRQEHEIARLGVGRKFQTPTIFPSLTVWQNMEVVVGARTGLFAALKYDAHRAERAHRRDARSVRIAKSGGHAGRNSLPRREAVAGDLDAAGAGPATAAAGRAGRGHEPGERERTAELFKRVLAAHPDRTLLIVEHDMAFVRQLASVVTVLHLGAVLSEGSLEEVQATRELLKRISATISARRHRLRWDRGRPAVPGCRGRTGLQPGIADAFRRSQPPRGTGGTAAVPG